MTAAITDPFAMQQGNPALSFKDKPHGTSYRCVVTGKPNLVQQRNFETGNLDTWPDGNPKMAAVVDVEIDGQPFSVWASKPSSLFAAIASAQQVAGATIDVGGVLTITYTHDVPNKTNPRLNPAKQYTATYSAPNAFGAAAEPAPAAAPAAAAPAAQTYTAEQLAALKAMGIDPTVLPLAEPPY